MPFDGRANKIAKAIKKGKYTKANTEALALFTNPSGPFRSKPININESAMAVLIANPRIPPNQVAIEIPIALRSSERYETYVSVDE